MASTQLRDPGPVQATLHGHTAKGMTQIEIKLRRQALHVLLVWLTAVNGVLGTRTASQIQQY